MGDTDVFTALANPTRRALLDLLRDRAQPVNELADRFAMTRPSVSEHLKVLRDAGLVTTEQLGRQRIYHVAPQRLREIADWLHPYERFWRGRLTDLRHHLDAQEDIEQ
ncbi:ArsR/SmtB family transcription factor [Phytoactinopolyspora limicola]|uniref:ArsR/SmtB family transcription factor n=1 Tax=Phytoactinopolyspora limicola TaxID=2715536 RepID=UPI00140E6181|nr:metalloregulator ArsR/SmtB family transcription factor [Phytoactinopolyspora limicola]